nr:hypothetical protein [Tanacetum cinerariifolium]
MHSNFVRGNSWVLIGDFSASLNLEDCHSGSQIILGWDLDHVDIMIVSQTDQFMHTQVFLKADQKGNLHVRVERLRFELGEAQKALDHDPSSHVLREEEYNQACMEEERFLKQKTKIEWPAVGDSNSLNFHKLIKSVVQRNRIEVLLDDVRDHMVRVVSNDETRKAMYSIGDSSAPSPDDSHQGWDIIGSDMCKAVRDLFTNGRLLKEINHMILALIPKFSTPLLVNDYRPILCCNVIYKCISKVIIDHIKDGVGFIDLMITKTTCA